MHRVASHELHPTHTDCLLAAHAMESSSRSAAAEHAAEQADEQTNDLEPGHHPARSWDCVQVRKQECRFGQCSRCLRYICGYCQGGHSCTENWWYIGVPADAVAGFWYQPSCITEACAASSGPMELVTQHHDGDPPHQHDTAVHSQQAGEATAGTGGLQSGNL